MATLTVTESTDFRGGLAELNITDIVFDTVAQATAEFTPTQFGAGLIANNVEITGDDQANIVQVTYAAQGESFSAAGWQFQDWDSETDLVFIVGIAGGDDTITGSSQNDLIAGGGGLDDIDAGGGNDTIWAGSVFTAGTILDGGSEFAGGVDQLTLLGVGTSDLRPADIIDLEQLSFSFGGQTAILHGNQVGGSGFTRIQGAGTSALTVLDDDVDLSGVTFLSWGADDTITIDGTSIVSNSLIGSNQADIIGGNGASADFITGGDGADTLNGGGGSDVFWYLSGGDMDAGEAIAGGSGTDVIWLDDAGSIDFGSATISGVEALDFIAGSSIATLGGDQIGGSEIDTVSGTAGLDALVVNAVDQAASLAGVSFSNWTVADTITINGSGLGDTLGGSVHNDTINGMGGTDAITGAAGDDTLNGGDNNDILAGGDNNDTLNGGENNDTLIGQNGNDTLNGGNGIDTASYSGAVAGVTVALHLAVAQNTGGDGIDTLSSIENLVGSGFADTLSGTSGNNTISGGGNNDALTGYAGDDTLNGDDGSDTLNGGASNDTLNGGSNNDTLIGQDGNDTLSGGDGSDTASYVGATGAVTVALYLAGAQNTGGDGTDTLSSIENLIGSNFADTLSGTSSINIISGGGNNDALTGYAGNDILNGDSGNDTLNGGADHDILYGGADNDTLIGQDGNDTLFGDNGVDTASYVGAVAGVTVALSVAGAQNTVGDGIDTLSSIENLIGSNFVDTLSGTSGDNTISGGGSNDDVKGYAGIDILNGDNGDDTLNGGASNDTLNGGANDDDLIGQDANDTLTGGSGADDFIFDDGHGIDTVTDFQNGADQFDLSAVAGIGDIDDLTIIDNGATVTVDYGTGSFTIANLADPGQLDASDFLF